MPIWIDLYHFEGLDDLPALMEDFSDFIFSIGGHLPLNNEIPLADMWEKVRIEHETKLNEEENKDGGEIVNA